VRRKRTTRLGLLDGFTLVVDGAERRLPIHAQRVLAYLALQQEGPHPGHRRTALADRLWTDVSAQRSLASLRTALWRIRQADEQIVLATRAKVQLDERVEVDVRQCMAQARRLVAMGSPLDPRDVVIEGLSGDLLPDWEEDWLLLERERIRQVQIHALEALAVRLVAQGHLLDAIQAAYVAIAAEPLRESAHATLIDIFVGEGDAVQAQRHLESYRGMLWTELGVRPSAALVGKLERGRRGA
jgi:DNA-binding SARP family transcriptional activator